MIVKAKRLPPAWASKTYATFYCDLLDCTLEGIPVNSTLFLILRVFEEFQLTEQLNNANST